MKMVLLLLLLLGWCSLGAPYTQKALEDQVHAMPGALEAPSSNQFSGYFQVSPSKFIHYIYYESERNPSQDSVVFWTNGGPGCSGMMGLFTEMGPWRPVSDGQLARNPSSWTKYASMVFVEQPVGVGYSYTTDDNDVQDFNDFRAARDNVMIVKQFFETYPERKGQDFYLASESYGGHYMVQWTLALLNDPGSAELRKHFKGYMVGNPYTSFASGTIAMMNVLWGLQLIPQPAWDILQSSSCDDLNNNVYHLMENAPECFAYFDVLYNFTLALNPYALEFPVCSKQIPLRRLEQQRGHRKGKSALRFQQQALQHYKGMQVNIRKMQEKYPSVDLSVHYDKMTRLLSDVGSAEAEDVVEQRALSTSAVGEALPGEDDDDMVTSPERDVRALQYDACSEYFMFQYMNQPDVMNALHVSPDWKAGNWMPCNDTLNENWAATDYLGDTTKLYSAIYNHPHKPEGFKMLIFSGDSDGVCATVGTQNWVYNIKNAAIKSLFKPWMYEDSYYGTQQGGYLTQFSDNLAFMTVHFAGHEVPAYQPEKALELFRRYLDGSVFHQHSASDEAASTQQGRSLSVAIAVLLSISAIIGLSICFQSAIKGLFVSK